MIYLKPYIYVVIGSVLLFLFILYPFNQTPEQLKESFFSIITINGLIPQVLNLPMENKIAGIICVIAFVWWIVMVFSFDKKS